MGATPLCRRSTDSQKGPEKRNARSSRVSACERHGRLILNRRALSDRLDDHSSCGGIKDHSYSVTLARSGGAFSKLCLSAVLLPLVANHSYQRSIGTQHPWGSVHYGIRRMRDLFSLSISWIEVVSFGEDVQRVMAIRMRRLTSGRSPGRIEAQTWLGKSGGLSARHRGPSMSALATGKSLEACVRRRPTDRIGAGFVPTVKGWVPSHSRLDSAFRFLVEAQPGLRRFCRLQPPCRGRFFHRSMRRPTQRGLNPVKQSCGFLDAEWKSRAAKLARKQASKRGERGEGGGGVRGGRGGG